MKNPPALYRYVFAISIGFLFVGTLFKLVGWPASELFSVLGGGVALVLYVIFSHAAQTKRHSIWARHVTFGSVVAGQVARSFDLPFGTYLFLLALVALLVWVAWSVLEELPPSEN